MDYVRHHALLDLKTEDGSTRRDYLLAAAHKGSRTALEALDGPELPEDLLYLMEWAYALVGRSGATMAGLAPLSYSTVADWARLMGVEPSPDEVQALMTLDAVIRSPEAGQEDAVPQERDRENTDAWPTRNDHG